MEPITLINEVSELMSAHGVTFHVENGWIVPYNKLPAIRATWFPREDSGRLEIEVLLEDERIINECFAGIGSGRTGLNDAFQNFCVNSFHVLSAAFWGIDDPDQVLTEKWDFQGKTYTAFIGNFGARGSAGINPDIPDDLFGSIESAIRNQPLNDKLSWFRCFFCNASGDKTFEALRNNQVWDSGLSALKSLPWLKANGYYSVRNFLILKENA